jgi:hypothetical protein
MLEDQDFRVGLASRRLTNLTGGRHRDNFGVAGGSWYWIRYQVLGIRGYQQPHIGPSQGVQQETGTFGP